VDVYEVPWLRDLAEVDIPWQSQRFNAWWLDA
jgi:hypothetical protein